MQALWRTLRNPSEEIAHVAFRVLGKFGGSNRKMLKEAQRLAFNSSDSPGPCLELNLTGCRGPFQLPVSLQALQNYCCYNIRLLIAKLNTTFSH